MYETLAQALEPDRVSAEQLNVDNRSILAVVGELIGGIPNCDPVLENWSVGFRTLNLLLPNLLNLPAAVVGQGVQRELVGIAMFASSNAAGCPFCTAHHCSFAIRWGAGREAVLGDRSPAQTAVAELAVAMATVPARLTASHIRAARAHLSEEGVEWIVLAVSLGGFLNKFMDTMGIELEDGAVTDVQALLRPTGWNPGKHLWPSEAENPFDRERRTLASSGADWTALDTSGDIPVNGFGTYLRFFRQAPGVVRLEKDWTRGVSGRAGLTLLKLEEEVGYGFPVLATINSQKAVRAIATALRDNLRVETSAVGIETKLLAGLVYAAHVGAELLTSESMVLIDLLVPGADPAKLAALRRLAEAPLADSVIPPGLSSREAAAILLARSASPSPAAVSEITIAMVTAALDPAEIVEIVVWLSLLQLLNRLYSYYEITVEIDDDRRRPAVAAAGLRPVARSGRSG